MKNTLVILIIAGMFGWAVYDFVSKAATDGIQQEVLNNQSLAGNQERASDDPNKVGLAVENFAPDFELVTLDGKRVKLSDYRGQRVLLNFWATWCPPCREEMPDMQKFHENEDVIILAVNLTETEVSQENVTKFVEKYGLTFEILMDEHVEVAKLYKIQPIPTTYMIDSSGRVQQFSFSQLNYEIMEQEFANMK